MRRNKLILLVGFYLLSLYASPNSFGQDTLKTDSAVESSINVTGRVDQKRVPLNRFLKFIVKIEWVGEIDRYQVSELEDPIMENFEVYSTSSADHRMSEGGVSKAARIYEFSLKPLSMGMGYIEGVMVKYIDNETGEGHHLITNRIEVEVVESVPEPGSNRYFFKWIISILIMLTIFGLVGYGLWKKKQVKKKHAEEIKVIPLEEEFLKSLHETIDLSKQELNVNNSFWELSTLFRKYLSKKYQFPALEYTTDQIMNELSITQVDERDLDDIKEILDKCDLVKFAGGEGKRPELERVYTLFESILESNLIRQKDEPEQDMSEQ